MVIDASNRIRRSASVFRPADEPRAPHQSGALERIVLVPASSAAAASTAAAAVAAATAASATAAAATAATITASAATAAAAAGAIFARLGFIDGELPAVMFLAVEGCDRGLCLGIAAHLHKAEALAAAGVTVGDHFGA